MPPYEEEIFLWQRQVEHLPIFYSLLRPALKNQRVDEEGLPYTEDLCTFKTLLSETIAFLQGYLEEVIKGEKPYADYRALCDEKHEYMTNYFEALKHKYGVYGKNAKNRRETLHKLYEEMWCPSLGLYFQVAQSVDDAREIFKAACHDLTLSLEEKAARGEPRPTIPFAERQKRWLEGLKEKSTNLALIVNEADNNNQVLMLLALAEITEWYEGIRTTSALHEYRIMYSILTSQGIPEKLTAYEVKPLMTEVNTFREKMDLILDIEKDIQFFRQLVLSGKIAFLKAILRFRQKDLKAWHDAVYDNPEVREYQKLISKQFKKLSLKYHPDKTAGFVTPVEEWINEGLSAELEKPVQVKKIFFEKVQDVQGILTEHRKLDWDKLTAGNFESFEAARIEEIGDRMEEQRWAALIERHQNLLSKEAAIAQDLIEGFLKGRFNLSFYKEGESQHTFIDLAASLCQRPKKFVQLILSTEQSLFYSQDIERMAVSEVERYFNRIDEHKQNLEVMKHIARRALEIKAQEAEIARYQEEKQREIQLRLAAEKRSAQIQKDRIEIRQRAELAEANIVRLEAACKKLEAQLAGGQEAQSFASSSTGTPEAVSQPHFNGGMFFSQPQPESDLENSETPAKEGEQIIPQKASTNPAAFDAQS